MPRARAQSPSRRARRVSTARAPSSAGLLDRCLRGDDEAWREFVDRYGDLIYSVARRSGASPVDADDIFQTSLLAIYGKLATLRRPEKLVPWLVSLTRRQAMSHFRRRRREVGESEETLDDMIDPAPLPEAELAALERAQLLHEALGDLRERCRTVLTALYLDESAPPSYAAVAQALGIPVGSLGPTRARCLAALRTALRARGWTGGSEGAS